MFKILLAEDNLHLRILIKKHLELRGFQVRDCANGADALSLLSDQKIDLVVTDIMMPVLDGIELTQKIKYDYPELPVILLTALDAIEDKKKGFACGADDYLVKPFEYDELEWRIRALLRRYGKVSLQTIRHGNTQLIYDEKALIINGKHVETTKKEFLLLFSLLSSPNKIFSRAQLLDDVWGADSESLERTVDVHINKLREKLAESDVKIVAVRGLGYKAEKNEKDPS